jgi:methionyl-tRNA formyltransferase
MPTDALSTFRQTDVGVNFVGDLLTGDMLDAPKYGILSFHPADLRQYRGLEPSVAYRDGVEEVVVTVQRLKDNIDSGLVVTEKFVPVSDCATLDELWGRVLSLYPEAISDALTNISDPKFEPTKINNLGEYYPPSLKRTFPFAARVALKDFIGRTVFRLWK